MFTKYSKLFSVFVLSAFFLLAIPSSAQAGVKVMKKPDSSYNVKDIKNIVVLPITSENVNYGKVDADRLPKIEAVMEKIKKILRRNLVDGSRQSNATINFHYDPPRTKTKTAILKANVDEFDNGSMAARMVPLAGKAKVTLRWQLIDSQSKAVITEFKAQVKDKDGMVGLLHGLGDADSDVLLSASHEANGKLYKHLSKLIGFEYDLFANMGEKVKTQTKDTGSVLKEETREIKKKK